MSGLFITFEGPECAGKTTQIHLLESALRQRGWHVICTREPGGTPLAEAMRRLLLERYEEKVSPEAELMLFAASRAQHVATLIRPHLEQGGVVICDRFIDSTVAYQGYARGFALEVIEQLNDLAMGGTRPDLTFLLDLPLEETRRRMVLRNGVDGQDRMEAEENAFHQKVRQGFLEYAKMNRERIRIINACDSIQAIAAYIRKETEDALDRI